MANLSYVQGNILNVSTWLICKNRKICPGAKKSSSVSVLPGAEGGATVVVDGRLDNVASRHKICKPCHSNQDHLDDIVMMIIF